MLSDVPRIGVEFLWRDKRWTIRGLRLEHAKLEVTADDGDVTILTIDDLREKVASGEIQRIVHERNGKEHVVAANWHDVESTRARDEREQRQSLLDLEASCIEGGMSYRDAYQELVKLCEDKGWKVRTERTLRNWRQRAGGHESMLSPQWHHSGNRRQGPDELLLQSMSDVMKDALLTSDRFNKADAWRHAEALYETRCTESGVKVRRASIRQFNRLLKNVQWLQQMKDRLDPITYRALTRVAVKLHKADHLWEIVEIDASLLEIFVCDEQGRNIGRPILYIAIDVASGYVVGFVLTIQKPSVMPFADCLRFMYFPKPDLDARYQIKNRIELFGKPTQLKVDNGSEFIGGQATELARQLLGDRAQCKPHTPQEKPHVERFFGTVRAYIKKLPGSTVSSVTTAKRVQSQSEQQSLLTLEELKGRLLRFIYDDYSFMMNESRSWTWRKALAPIDIVRELKKHQMEPFPVNREEFERAMHFRRDTRSLNHEGIAFDGFTYHSAELADVYRTHGAGKYAIFYSDVSATEIFVQPPDNSPAVPAYAKQLQGESIDRKTAKAIAKELRREGKQLDRRAIQERLRQYEDATRDAKSVTSKNKQARLADTLKHAREAIQPSMPQPATAHAQTPSSDAPSTAKPSDQGSPSDRTFGRTRGARRP